MECRQTFANGTWSNVPDDQCNVRSKKPPTRMTCNSIACFKWRVEYPCLSCGGNFINIMFVLHRIISVLCAVWLSQVIRRLCSRPNVRRESHVYHLLFRDEFQLCSHRLLQRQAQRNKASSRDDRKSSKQHQLVPYDRDSGEMR